MNEDICNQILSEINCHFTNEPISTDNLEFSDNLGEILEKLIILHIRVWKMEDMIAQTQTDTEIADLKRKIDFCFKIKRPKLIRAFNLLVDNYVKQNKSFAEEDIKLYKGFK